MTTTTTKLTAQELRIGNKILFNEQYYTVSGIDGKHVSVIESRNLIAIYSIEPIPLTPERLEKAGFTMSAFRAHDYEIVIDKEDNTTFTIECFVGENEDVDHGRAGIFVKREEWHFLPYPVQYLHQLQNLYFALTGEELAIEL